MYSANISWQLSGRAMGEKVENILNNNKENHEISDKKRKRGEKIEKVEFEEFIEKVTKPYPNCMVCKEKLDKQID